MRLKRVDKKHIELHHKTAIGSEKYLKSIVYGGLDGIITTFAVVAGVAGAALGSGIILILGFANLIADGISMAIGDYLSTKSENEFHELEKKHEKEEVKNYPEAEKEEMIEFYIKKGINRQDAIKLVNIIFKNKKLAVETLVTEELDIPNAEESPVKNAVFTFLSFFVFGLIPLVIYIIHYLNSSFISNTFIVTIILTAIALFLLGSFKVRITGKNWLYSGIETLVIGGVAASAAFLVGRALAGMAG
ncbi:VIT1/CCC1 transporter family protein [Candidatus Pacearchaeota archaeon]|nr:VIT1/CCC1 transporter family protein [Candidatus Pacearchaeota archaeon]